MPTKFFGLVGFTAIEPSTSPLVARISPGLVATVHPGTKGDGPETKVGTCLPGGGTMIGGSPPPPPHPNSKDVVSARQHAVLRCRPTGIANLCSFLWV